MDVSGDRPRIYEYTWCEGSDSGVSPWTTGGGVDSKETYLGSLSHGKETFFGFRFEFLLDFLLHSPSILPGSVVGAGHLCLEPRREQTLEVVLLVEVIVIFQLDSRLDVDVGL